MWIKHQRIYQDHLNYISNDIVNPFRVKIIHYDERFREIYDLARYIPPPSMKGISIEADNWTVRNQEFTVSDISLSIKDGLP